ncbi:MAG TPA: hypothetical protein GXX21_00290 [Syntrophomonadaceae bacterium]|nr:hypothetical protein [Syntrophomonadaceae bacterium]
MIEDIKCVGSMKYLLCPKCSRVLVKSGRMVDLVFKDMPAERLIITIIGK